MKVRSNITLGVAQLLAAVSGKGDRAGGMRMKRSLAADISSGYWRRRNGTVRGKKAERLPATVTLAVNSNAKKRLAAAAEMLGASQSDLIRAAVHAVLPLYEKEAKAVKAKVVEKPKRCPYCRGCKGA